MATKIATAFAAALAIVALTMTANQDAFARDGYRVHSGKGGGFGYYGGYPYVYNGYDYRRGLGFYGSNPSFYRGSSATYDSEACKYTVYWCP
ncbi:MAG: hypothetical protein U1E20_00345 [Methylocystis sp.]|uniref:hypothetical protein n=1 Tax=Methylocystis sp. TaxID=1911079 RepID=UPI0039418C2A